MTRSICPEMGFISGGARGLHHFTEMVGADAVVTINWQGTADTLIQQDPVVVLSLIHISMCIRDSIRIGRRRY